MSARTASHESMTVSPPISASQSCTAPDSSSTYRSTSPASGTMTQPSNEGAPVEGRRRPAGEPADEERRFAEELGFYWEDAGGTRMAGRVFGALLLADPPEMSSLDLARALGISAGSVSTATRELVRPGLVERVRVPGEREDYFRATMGAGALPGIVRNRIELTRRWQRLMERGEELAEDKDPAVRRQLAEIREFYEFLEQENEAILARWEQRRRGRRSS
jgi:DNA-binding transcriptional regulator GbsR (MarR family)